MPTSTESGFRLTPQLLLGLIIIGIGLVFTLDNLGVANFVDYIRYWPLALVAVGLLKLHQARETGGTLAGFLLIAAGAWLLLGSFGIVHVRVRQLWPMILVFFGATLVWQGLHARQRASGTAGDANSTISGLAVLGGVARGNNSRDFRGGDLTAVMGGCEIDLRQAAIDGEADLNVFAMWGGIEIRVPEDWTVIGRVTPILGGFEDKTRPPQGASTHRLIVRGFAIMGGVEVKN
jgi:predicted membrane protein